MMNERIYNLARQAEQHAREHVRDCEYYGYTMIEGTAEDEFHAEFRDRFAELIVKECANLCKVVGADKVSNGSEDYNAGREMGAEVCHNMIKKHFGVEE